MVSERTLEGLGAATSAAMVCLAEYPTGPQAAAVARLLRAAGIPVALLPVEVAGQGGISLRVPPEFSDLAEKTLAKRRREVEDEGETDDEEEEEEEDEEEVDEDEDEEEDFDEDDEEFEEEFEDDELDDDDDDIFYDDDDDE